MGVLLGQGNNGVGLSDGLGDCSGADKRARAELEATIAKYLTQSDMNMLTAGLTPRIQPNPQSIAFFEAGEHDCKHKNVSDKHKRFRSQLQALLRQRIAEAAEQQASTPEPEPSPSPSNGGDYNYTPQEPSGSTGGNVPQTQPAQSSNTATYIAIGAGSLVLIGISVALLN